MKRLILLLAGVFLAAAASKPTVAISDAWMREPNPARPVAAAFMTLHNPSTSEIALLNVTSTVAKRIELHEMKTENGMMKMRQVEKIAIPANGTVKLEPGGLHLMLFDLTREVKGGDSVEFGLQFSDGTSAKIIAKVRSAEE